MITETTTQEAVSVLLLGRSADQGGPLQAFAAPDQPAIVNGQPAKYFWCNGIKVGGKYIAHTIDHKTGAKRKTELSCPESTAKQLLENAEKMRAKGVRVPVVTDHVQKADNSRGWMIALRRNGDWLQGLLQMIGDDAILAASRNEVSFGIAPNFIDGEGDAYGPAVQHVALTPNPVVPDQQGLIAASRGEEGDQPQVFLLSTANLPERKNPMKPEHRQKALKLMSNMDGVSDAMDDESLMSRLLDHHEKMADEYGKLASDVTNLHGYCANLSLDSDVLEERAVIAEAKVAHLSRDPDADTRSPREILLSRIDSDLVGERYERIASKADHLAVKGWSPAAIGQIKAALIGTPELPNIYCLSRDGADSVCVADSILDALATFKPDTPATGEAMLSRTDVLTGAPAAPEAKKPNPWLSK